MGYAKNKAVYMERIRSRSNQTYGFFFYLPLFLILSFTGWLWEIALYLIKDGEFVNRGVFFGPWLPIYGLGGVILAYALRRIEYRPVSVFFCSMLIGSALEYFTGFCLERIWGIRWWDYSNEFMNIDGRVCLWSSLLFGLGGWLLVCYCAPYLRLLYRKLWRLKKGGKALQIISLVLLLIFIADAAWAADFPNMGLNITYSL